MDFAHVAEAVLGAGGVVGVTVAWLRERSRSRAKIEELHAETEAGRDRALTALVEQLTLERRDATPAHGIQVAAGRARPPVDYGAPPDEIPPELAPAVVALGPYRSSPPRAELDRALERVERLEKIVLPLASEVADCRRDKLEGHFREAECLRALDAVWAEYQGYRQSIDPRFVPQPRPAPAPLTRPRATPRPGPGAPRRS